MRMISQRTSKNTDPIVSEIKRQLDLCIQQNPIEYNRYKSIISDEYFFILMHSDMDHDKKIELLENHFKKWGRDSVTSIKPLVWD